MLSLAKQFLKLQYIDIDPHTPIAQKVADEVVFRRFQGVEFFLNRTSLNPSDF